MKQAWKKGLDGCDVFPTCLTCPAPVCKYDDWAEFNLWLKHLRYETMAGLIEDGWTQRDFEALGNSTKEVIKARKLFLLKPKTAGLA